MRPASRLVMGFMLAPALIQGCVLNLPPDPPLPEAPPQAQPLPPQQQPQPPAQQQPPQQLPPPQAPAPLQPPQAPVPAPAAPPATKVSVFDKATFTDLAVGPDGTRHALYQEITPDSGREHVFYRASTDGGKTWSEAINLSEFDLAHRAGFIRVAVDGEGRVYAFWKATAEWYDNPGGSVYSGTLVYRVLEGGGWSRPQEVSAPNGTYSWFPSVDPNGQLHVIWNEVVPYGQIFQVPQDGGLVLQATVTGTMLGPKQEVYRAPLLTRTAPDGLVAGQAVEGLTGLKGYVDAAGTAHWVAEKFDFERNTNVIVHWDGAQETYLFDQDRFTLKQNFTEDPPQLVRDDRGIEHVLVRDSSTETHALLDFALPNAQAVTVRQAIDFKGFNVVQGPGGRTALVYAAKDIYGPDSRYDLFASVYRNGTWSPAANLTSNLAEDQVDGGQTEQAGAYYTHTFHDANFAAGAFDANGRLNVLYIDDAATQVDVFGNLGTKLGPVSSTVKPAAFFSIM